MKTFLQELIKWKDFKGRTNRKDFWTFNISIFLVFLLFGLLTQLLGHSAIFGTLALIFWVLTLIPVLSSIVRRLHDIGSSGLLVLVYFIPILGQLILLVLLLAKSKESESRI